MHDVTLGFLIGKGLVGKEAFPCSESTSKSHWPLGCAVISSVDGA